MSHNIKQYDNISLLGVTIQGNYKFGLLVKAKLHEANKCLFVIRSLHKDGYTQDEIDHLFNSIVIPKLLYGLSVYAASISDLNVIHSPAAQLEISGKLCTFWYKHEIWHIDNSHQYMHFQI